MRDLPETQHSLLIQLSQNSEDAWETFVEIYQKAIYDFCRRKGLQDADASDVTQEVLAAVGQRVGSWDHDPAKGSFRGWLYRVARNMAVNCLIARKRKAAGSGDSRVLQLLNQMESTEEKDSDAFLNHYRTAMFRWAANLVKPLVNSTNWQAFYLTALKHQSPQEVAQQLGLTVGGVYTAKCRVFARIKEVIFELGDDFELPELEENIELESDGNDE